MVIVALQLPKLMAQFPEDHFDRLEASAVVELAGTQRLTLQGDIASELVSGVDRFLLRQLDASVKDRRLNWPEPKADGGRMRKRSRNYAATTHVASVSLTPASKPPIGLSKAP
jgi:hypothetical protein